MAKSPKLLKPVVKKKEAEKTELPIGTLSVENDLLQNQLTKEQKRDPEFIKRMYDSKFQAAKKKYRT